MKRLTALLIVVAMALGGATALMAADLPQVQKGVLAGEKSLPDADLAKISGKGYVSITLGGLDIAYTRTEASPASGVGLTTASSVIKQLIPHSTPPKPTLPQK
jgi:hypothetical protein